MHGAKPGILPEELRKALGMGENSPPPWLINMQRYGPPPSYPDLKARLTHRLGAQRVIINLRGRKCASSSSKRSAVLAAKTCGTLYPVAMHWLLRTDANYKQVYRSPTCRLTPVHFLTAHVRAPKKREQ